MIMKKSPDTKLIVMLTHNDKTVTNALALFNECADLDVDYWGIKTEPLSLEEMKAFVEAVHSKNKTAVFESVCYTEKEGILDARKAFECNCDILMGTKYSDKINSFCKEHNIRYMPFIGKPSLVPSILEGTWQDFAFDIDSSLKNNTFGVDYLAYRHVQDPHKILKDVFANSKKTNVCIAGSVDSFNKIDEIISLGASFFTIGSAFFENCFGQTISEQIEKVADYIKAALRVKSKC